MAYDAESTICDSCIGLHPEVPRPASSSRSYAVQRITTILNQQKQMTDLPSLWLRSSCFPCNKMDSSSLKVPHTLHCITCLIRHLALRYNLVRISYRAHIMNAWVGWGNWPRSNHCPCPKKVHFYLQVYCMNKAYKTLPLVGPVRFLPHAELKCHPHWNVARCDKRTGA
jgi:hypothetical protein